jgi:hypothetical protein
VDDTALARLAIGKDGGLYIYLLLCWGYHEVSVCESNQSFNFCNALPRWEILFFSDFSISAYVLPSYSKQESHPSSRRQPTSKRFYSRYSTHRILLDLWMVQFFRPFSLGRVSEHGLALLSTQRCRLLAQICPRSHRAFCEAHAVREP